MPPACSGDSRSKLLVWAGWSERPQALQLPLPLGLPRRLALPQSLDGSRIRDQKAGYSVLTGTELAQAEMEGLRGRSDRRR